MRREVSFPWYTRGLDPCLLVPSHEVFPFRKYACYKRNDKGRTGLDTSLKRAIFADTIELLRATSFRLRAYKSVQCYKWSRRKLWLRIATPASA